MSIEMSTRPASGAGQRSPIVIPHETGRDVRLGGFGIHWKIDGDESGEHFPVDHHPIAPHALRRRCIGIASRTSIPSAQRRWGPAR